MTLRALVGMGKTSPEREVGTQAPVTYLRQGPECEGFWPRKAWNSSPGRNPQEPVRPHLAPEYHLNTGILLPQGIQDNQTIQLLANREGPD